MTWLSAFILAIIMATNFFIGMWFLIPPPHAIYGIHPVAGVILLSAVVLGFIIMCHEAEGV